MVCVQKSPLSSGVIGLNFRLSLHLYPGLTVYLIETPFNAFANSADPDQAALVRAYLIETPFNAFANSADPDQAALVRAA